MRKLVGDGRLTRHKLAGQFLYCAADRPRHGRRLLTAAAGSGNAAGRDPLKRQGGTKDAGRRSEPVAHPSGQLGGIQRIVSAQNAQPAKINAHSEASPETDVDAAAESERKTKLRRVDRNGKPGRHGEPKQSALRRGRYQRRRVDDDTRSLLDPANAAAAREVREEKTVGNRKLDGELGQESRDVGALILDAQEGKQITQTGQAETQKRRAAEGRRAGPSAQTDEMGHLEIETEARRHPHTGTDTRSHGHAVA